MSDTYRVIQVPISQLQKELNEQAKRGWKTVSYFAVGKTCSIILKRTKKADEIEQAEFQRTHGDY